MLVLSEAGDEEGEPAVVLHDSTLILEHLSGVAFPREMGYLYPPELKDQVCGVWLRACLCLLVLRGRGDQPNPPNAPQAPTPTHTHQHHQLKPQVKALVADFDATLGVQSRRVAYWEMAQARRTGVSTANPALFTGPQIPRVEGWLWWALEGKILPKMLEFMDINQTTATQALDDCRAAFARASALLMQAEPGGEGKGEPRRYLLGTERMTAADLTFAALAYPLLAPPQFASMVGVGVGVWAVAGGGWGLEKGGRPAISFHIHVHTYTYTQTGLRRRQHVPLGGAPAGNTGERVSGHARGAVCATPLRGRYVHMCLCVFVFVSAWLGGTYMPIAQRITPPKKIDRALRRQALRRAQAPDAQPQQVSMAALGARQALKQGVVDQYIDISVRQSLGMTVARPRRAGRTDGSSDVNR